MRDNLLRRAGRTCLYRGTFTRYGLRRMNGGSGETVLISDIEDEQGRYLTSHVWFNNPRPFRKLDLRAGDTIEFTARIEAYTRRNGGQDYRLSLPTRIRILSD